MTGRAEFPSLSSFSPNALVHLSWALSGYQQQAERSGLAIPPELVRLMLSVSSAAMSGQPVPVLAEPLQGAQASAVTTTNMALLTKAETAEALGCSERTVARRIADGKLPVRRIGGLVRVDLAAYLNGGDASC